VVFPVLGAFGLCQDTELQESKEQSWEPAGRGEEGEKMVPSCFSFAKLTAPQPNNIFKYY
jgi:hypothetical protein